MCVSSILERKEKKNGERIFFFFQFRSKRKQRVNQSKIYKYKNNEIKLNNNFFFLIEFNYKKTK